MSLPNFRLAASGGGAGSGSPVVGATSGGGIVSTAAGGQQRESKSSCGSGTAGPLLVACTSSARFHFPVMPAKAQFAPISSQITYSS